MLLLTLLGLRESERRRSTGNVTADRSSVLEHQETATGHEPECESACAMLIRDEAVQDAIAELYQPAEGTVTGTGPDVTAAGPWASIDFGSLEFHCHGTTSIILRGRDREVSHGIRNAFALKLVLYPFLRIPTVAASTESYMAAYNQSDAPSSHLVRVWASAAQWILMDLVQGIALSDLLACEPLLSRKMADPSLSLSQILAELIRGERDGGDRLARHPAARHGPIPAAELLRIYRSLPRVHRAAADPHTIDFTRMRTLGSALFDALGDLESRSIRHEDLAPQNIMAVDSVGWQFRLVDLGRNYLYTHSVTGSLSLEASYIAPEVRKGDAATATTDLYSLAQLLIEFGGVPHAWDGRIPDEYYVRAPLLARLLEDLADREPDRRLSIFSPPPDAPVYHHVRGVFRDELEVAEVAGKEKVNWSTRPGVLSILSDLRKPLNDAPARQWHLWQARRRLQASADPVRGMHAQWLLAWAMVAAAAWYLTMSVTVSWLLRDVGWGWQNFVTEAIQRVAGTQQSDTLPVIDSWRAAGYIVPDWRDNLPARLIGISYVLAGGRYYQALFSGISPLFAYHRRDKLGVKAAAAEFFMRLSTIVAMCLVLYITLVNASDWLIASAIGRTIVLASNWTVRMFTSHALREAARRELTIVRYPDEVTGLREFIGWTPTSVVYVCALWLLSILLHFNIIHDTYVYMVLGTVINVVLFYVVKCGTRAPEVRIALTRACAFAERLRLCRG